MPVPIVTFENVTRRFGDLAAVRSATLELHEGEVLALLGENGAGKSTLMKLLYGIYPPSEGRILLRGAPSPIRGPADAARQGIGMVFQSFSQIPALSVRDNLLAAWPKTPFWVGKRNRAVDAALATLRRLAPDLDPDRKVSEISVGEQQVLELCKALNVDARLIILDEPTSVLTPSEAASLYGLIRQLAADGVSVVLITHKLADVEACADRIAVMRRGEIVDVSPAGARPMPETVRLMMGEASPRIGAKLLLPDRPVERLHLRAINADAPGVSLRDISLTVSGGEIVGIAGVAGNGQTLLAEAVASIQPISSGDIVLDGESIARRQDDKPMSTALGYIPESPRSNAVVESLDLATNLQLRALAGGGPTVADQMPALDRFDIRPREPAKRAGLLSGGNLQKLVVARELGVQRPAVLACYPTMGLDLNATSAVYAELVAQAKGGAAVLWISEDLDDLLAMAHRIAVLHHGRIVAVLDNDGTLTREQIGTLMTGRSAA